MTIHNPRGRRADPTQTQRGRELAMHGVRLPTWDHVRLIASSAHGWIDTGRTNGGQAAAINNDRVAALDADHYEATTHNGHVYVRYIAPGPRPGVPRPYDICLAAAREGGAQPLHTAAVTGEGGVPIEGWTFDDEAWTMTYSGDVSQWGVEVRGTHASSGFVMRAVVDEAYRRKGISRPTVARMIEMAKEPERDTEWFDMGLTSDEGIGGGMNPHIAGGFVMVCATPVVTDKPDLKHDLAMAVALHGQWVPLRTAAVLGTGDWGDFAWRFDGPRLLMKCVGQIGPVRWDGSGEYRRDTSPLAAGMTYDDSHVPDAARTRGIFDDM